MDSPKQYDPNASYMVICDGKAVTPHWVDSILDLWTAEAICEFIKEVCPDKVVTMQAVTFIDKETQHASTDTEGL